MSGRGRDVVVKICGVTRPEDAAACVAAGADWIGLNFWPRSKRFVDGIRAREVAEAARRAGSVALVGVFVNQPIAAALGLAGAVGLDYVQLHGDETPAMVAEAAAGEPRVEVIKAVSLGGPDDVKRIDAYGCETILVDTPTAGYGGSGERSDWGLAAAAVTRGKRVVLAGGLDADNVAAAIAAVGPFGVDVASGVESEPGVKDHDQVRRFVDAAKGAR